MGISNEMRGSQSEWVESLVEEVEDRGGSISAVDVDHSLEMWVRIDITVPAGALPHDE